MKPPRALVWFRRDLRLHDNPALSEATRTHDEVVALWLVTPDAWKAHDEAAVKVDFWLRAVDALSASLSALHIPLRIETAGRVPEVVLAVMRAHHCTHLVFNNEYEVNEHRRDDAVEAAVTEAGFTVTRHDTRLLTHPDAIRTKTGTPFKVFTPFRKRWLAVLADTGWKLAPAPRAASPIAVKPSRVPAKVEGFVSRLDPALWPATEKEALARLKRFITHRARDYHEGRDRPAVDGTSTLSPYLAAGLLSPRKALAAAADANHGELVSGAVGLTTWINELAWRDFYAHVMIHFPRVSMSRAFLPHTEKLAWRDAPEDFKRWCEGETGFPLVDAGMRQLRETGWMHNRVRMVVASFLVKDLLLDWRLGERHFMQHLVDGDLAANNGGWQWAASTGTDPQPWFRIFNPASQAEKFDPDGAYIGRWVAPLKGLSLKQMEKLSVREREARGYVAPMVNHDEARARTLAAFKALKKPDVGSEQDAPKD